MPLQDLGQRTVETETAVVALRHHGLHLGGGRGNPQELEQAELLEGGHPPDELVDGLGSHTEGFVVRKRIFRLQFLEFANLGRPAELPATGSLGADVCRPRLDVQDSCKRRPRGSLPERDGSRAIGLYELRASLRSRDADSTLASAADERKARGDKPVRCEKNLVKYAGSSKPSA